MRDTIIIGIACLATILLGAWLYVSGTNTDGLQAKGGAAAAVTFSVLDQGNKASAVTERKNYRIKNQDQLKELWQMTHDSTAPSEVDFSKNDVIAVFDGTHPTGGYEISVASIADTDTARMVAIVHTEPGKSCAHTEDISSPFQLIVVPKSDAPITREDKTAIHECD